MKDKLLQIRVDGEFLSKLNYLREINGCKTTAETLRKIVEKEFRKEQRSGKWIGKPLAGYCTVKCSCCGDAFIDNDGRWGYCPTCGARME